MIFLTIITALACLVLAGLIYSRNSRHPAHQAMSLLSICLASWAVTNYLSLQDVSLDQRFFWVRVVMVVTAPIPLLFLQFALHFPVGRTTFPPNTWRFRLKKAMPLLLGWTIVLMLLAMTPLMFSRYWLENGQPHLETKIGAVAYGLTFFSLSALSIGLLSRTYRWQKGLARLQTAYVLFGLGLTVATGFFTNFVLVAVFQRFELVALGPSCSLFLLGCISYAMLRHRLLDLKWAVVRCFAYVATLGTITVLYCFALSDLFNELGGYLPIMSQRVAVAIGMVGAAVSFPFMLKFAQRITRRLFYQSVFQPERGYQIMAEIASRSSTAKKLLAEFDSFFCTQFGVQWSGILIASKEEQSSLGQLLHSTTLEQDSNLLVFDELMEGELKEAFRTQNVAVVILLRLQQNLIGWLCLGPKHSGDAFPYEELQFCQVIAPQIALALEHVNQIDQMKDEFVSIASHELRTPMTAIRSYLWLCLFKPSFVIPDQVRQHLQVAYTATERLLELVRDLLTISQIESQHITMKLEEVSLSDVVREVLTELEVSATAKNIQLIANSNLEDTFYLLDKVKISEVLHNLVGNAIKFSLPDSEVAVEVTGNPHQLAVSIKDQGPGISEKNLERLFQKFGVIQHSYQKSPESGTGLGLYISQQLAHLHNGRITVNSQIGKGTTFTLFLPRKNTATIPALEANYAKAALATAY